MELTEQIKAILFTEATAVSKRNLMKILGINAENLQQALNALSKSLENTSLTLIETPQEVALRVSTEYADFVNKVLNKNLKLDLGKSALETLAIIAYLKQAKKQEIDYIRGVNSQTSLRGLLLRGLITKQKKGNEVEYAVKPEALAKLGVSNVEQLPDFDKVYHELTQLLKS